MKKLNLNIILFLIVLFSLSIVNVFYFGESNISELENRALAVRPHLTLKSIFDTSFFKQYENYFSDHFAFRDNLVQISSNIKEFRGFIIDDGPSIVKHEGANVSEFQPVPAPPENKAASASDAKELSLNSAGTAKNNSNATSELPASNGVKAAGTMLGSMLLLNDSAMETYSFNEEGSRFYADTLNSFKERLEDNIKVYSMLVPLAIEFTENETWRTGSYSQRMGIGYVNSHLSKDIIPVNIYDALRSNRDKYIYFRTDHHWTALGAYFAYTAFANTIGDVSVPLERYESGKIPGFLGSTYSATLSRKLRNNPDTITYYKPFTKHEYYIYYQGPLKMNLIDLSHADKKNKYRIFLSGDRPLGKIVTDIQNDRRILIIKDSYGNAFVPFLLPHYKEIYIVDPRQFNKNIYGFIKEKGIQEVLFLNYASAANSRGFAQLILNLMK